MYLTFFHHLGGCFPIGYQVKFILKDLTEVCNPVSVKSLGEKGPRPCLKYAMCGDSFNLHTSATVTKQKRMGWRRMWSLSPVMGSQGCAFYIVRDQLATHLTQQDSSCLNTQLGESLGII